MSGVICDRITARVEGKVVGPAVIYGLETGGRAGGGGGRHEDAKIFTGSAQEMQE